MSGAQKKFPLSMMVKIFNNLIHVEIDLYKNNPKIFFIFWRNC